jgi:hypothetical protein
MMKQAVMEFNDREIIVHRSRFEAKDFALTEEVMRKAGALGFFKRSCAREIWRHGYGFCVNGTDL